MLYEIYKPNSLNSDSFNLKIVVFESRHSKNDESKIDAHL